MFYFIYIVSIYFKVTKDMQSCTNSTVISFCLTGNSGHIIMCRRKFFYTSPLWELVSQSLFLPSFFLCLLTVSWEDRVVDLFRLSLGGWCETAVVLFSLHHWIYLVCLYFSCEYSHRLFRSSFFLVVCVTLWVLSPSLQSRHSFHLSFILATLLTVPT